MSMYPECNAWRHLFAYRGICIKPWQNENTRCKKHLLLTHVPRQCSATRQYVSTMQQKHILQLETILSVWQNWETFGNVSAASVSGNMLTTNPYSKRVALFNSYKFWHWFSRHYPKTLPAKRWLFLRSLSLTAPLLLQQFDDISR